MADACELPQSSTKMLFFRILFVFVLIVRVKCVVKSSQDCNIPAIYNFGDSNSDTGGISAALSRAGPPTGETYFGISTGRASDGRLIIDFIGKIVIFLNIFFSHVFFSLLNNLKKIVIMKLTDWGYLT